MSALRLPAGIAGANLFVDARWWAGGSVVELPDASWEGERTLLVVAPVREWLEEPSATEFDAWVRQVCALAPGRTEGSCRLAVSPGAVSSLEQLRALAEGRRWPVTDPAGASRHAPGDPVPVPAAGGVAREYAEALVGHLTPGLQGSWITDADATADAVACVASALDADPRLTPGQARELRAATRRGLAALGAAGVVVTGPSHLLLWPVPAEDGRVPLDVAADAAVEVMLGQLERGTGR